MPFLKQALVRAFLSLSVAWLEKTGSSPTPRHSLLLVNFYWNMMYRMLFYSFLSKHTVHVWIMHSVSSLGSLQQKKAAVCSWFIQSGGFVSYQRSMCKQQFQIA